MAVMLVTDDSLDSPAFLQRCERCCAVVSLKLCWLLIAVCWHGHGMAVA